jgi:hypothetical protein
MLSRGTTKDGTMKSIHLISFVFLSILALVRPANAGLIDHWTFNETSGSIAHDSAGAFNGILQGGATFLPGGGISGGAVSLNVSTSSMVNMGTSFPGLTNTSFSLVIWEKTTQTANAIILSKHEASADLGFFIDMNPPLGQGGASFNTSNGALNRTFSTRLTLDDGNWHQIVGVYTLGGASPEAQIYVDGQLEATNTTASTVGANTSAFVIGGYGETNTDNTPVAQFTGLIDDVQIYNNALSASDVSYLYNNPGQTVPEPSVLSLLVVGAIGLGWAARRRSA